MLQAESGEERQAAALTQIPLGKSDESLPVLLQAAGRSADLYAKADQALHWLPWTQRVTLFWKLDEIAPSSSARAGLVSAMNSVQDRRVNQLYWKILDRADVSHAVAEQIQYGRTSLEPTSRTTDG